VNYVSIYILKTIVSHAAKQKPRANVWILLDSQGILASTASINVQSCKVTRKLAPILGNETPFWKFFLFRPLYVESTDLVATEFNPEHIVGQIKHEVVLF